MGILDKLFDREKKARYLIGEIVKIKQEMSDLYYKAPESDVYCKDPDEVIKLYKKLGEVFGKLKQFLDTKAVMEFRDKTTFFDPHNDGREIPGKFALGLTKDEEKESINLIDNCCKEIFSDLIAKQERGEVEIGWTLCWEKFADRLKKSELADNKGHLIPQLCISTIDTLSEYIKTILIRFYDDEAISVYEEYISALKEVLKTRDTEQFIKAKDELRSLKFPKERGILIGKMLNDINDMVIY